MQTHFVKINKRRRPAFYFALLLSALFIAGCSNKESPEDRVRALIDQAETAVEKKAIGELRDMVSDNYRDTDGRDRRAIDGILRLYLLRNDTIHLFTRIKSIRFPAPKQGEAVVYVAMAGRPITSAAELGTFRANLYRFEIGFSEEDGEWRVVRATWRPAEPADFIYQKEAEIEDY